jgi:hypothetical protein
MARSVITREGRWLRPYGIRGSRIERTGSASRVSLAVEEKICADAPAEQR